MLSGVIADPHAREGAAFSNVQVHDAVTWVVSTIASVACSIADHPPEDFRR